MAERRTVVAGVASAALVAALVGWEGYRDRAYDDGVGVQTIGFGTTTRADGTPVRRGDATDPVRAVQRLAADADAIAKRIAACIGPVPLYQHEWDAYVSLAYNIGADAFCGSTLVRLLKQAPPDYLGACKQILRWNMAGGRGLPGLVKRREAEYRMCMGDA